MSGSDVSGKKFDGWTDDVWVTGASIKAYLCLVPMISHIAFTPKRSRSRNAYCREGEDVYECVCVCVGVHGGNAIIPNACTQARRYPCARIHTYKRGAQFINYLVKVGSSRGIIFTGRDSARR